MFSINLIQISNCSSSMQQVVRRWDGQAQEIESVIGGLSSFSGMEDIIQRLKKQKKELEAETQTMIQMSQAADKIRSMYDGSENKIVNNADGVIISGKKMSYSINKDIFGNEDIWTLPKKKTN